MESGQQPSFTADPPSSPPPIQTHRGFWSKRLFKLKRLASYLGLHKRTIFAEGFRYRERTGISIRRAMSDTGSGVKEYDLKFPRPDAEHRRGMRIRYTKNRLYNDVGFDPRTFLYAQVLRSITPGKRVLEIGCGTGAGSAMLAQSVGPSGGVVAITRDGESIRFARHRYPSDHCGFELGWIETLDGEINGGFDAIFTVDPMRDAPDAPSKARMIAELIRVLAPGGLMMAVLPDPSDFQPIFDGFAGFGLQSNPDQTPSITCPRSGWVGMVFQRSQETQDPPHHRHQGPDYPGTFQS